ncbi:uncharacterized protein [Ptychodera flava]|uniref:uncharacterized protein n=1 Tax=Ptychodera flava TaxID=63121 RepID=UPI00396A4C26
MGSSPSDQPETIKPVHTLRAFQDGRLAHAEGSPERRRLDMQGGSEGCLLKYTGQSDTSKYLKFQWRQKMYQFLCLTFGLASAPRIFTKLMKPVIAILRRLGIRLIIYLDDIRLMNQSKELLLQDRDTLLFLLQQLGFGINWKKSFLTPSQEIEFLGFLINSVTMRMMLPENKITQLVDHCMELSHKAQITVRELAKVIGKMTASMAAIFPALLHCRYLQMTKTRSLIHNQSYESLVTLPQECREELQWWCHHLKEFNRRTIICPYPDLIITSDASKRGGAHSQDMQTGGAWTAQETTIHINILELLAAFLALQTFKGKQNLTVLMKIDNCTAVAYINKMGGTKSKSLVTLAKEMWNYCLFNKLL